MSNENLSVTITQNGYQASIRNKPNRNGFNIELTKARIFDNGVQRAEINIQGRATSGNQVAVYGEVVFSSQEYQYNEVRLIDGISGVEFCTIKNADGSTLDYVLRHKKSVILFNIAFSTLRDGAVTIVGGSSDGVIATAQLSLMQNEFNTIRAELERKADKINVRQEYGKVAPTALPRGAYNFDTINAGDYLFYDEAVNANSLNKPPFRKAVVSAERFKGTTDLIVTAIDLETGKTATRIKNGSTWRSWWNVITSNALSSAVNSTSTTMAATSNAVKIAYDKAVEAEGKGLPVGAVVAFPLAVTNPQGFLKCDGTAFNQATYPALYAALGNKTKLPDLRRSDVGLTAWFPIDAIPSGWIAFDNIDTQVTQQSQSELYNLLVAKYGSLANVPKVGDRYIRNASGGLSVGATQEDAIRNIVGYFGSSKIPHHNGLQIFDDASAEGAFGIEPKQWRAWTSDNNQGGNSVTGVNFDASRVVPTADENRPKTLVLKLCIKTKNSLDDVVFWIRAFGSVSNAGSLDASRLAQDLQAVRAEKANQTDLQAVQNALANKPNTSEFSYQKIGEFEIIKYPDGTMIQTWIHEFNDIFRSGEGFGGTGEKQLTWAVAFKTTPIVLGNIMCTEYGTGGTVFVFPKSTNSTLYWRNYEYTNVPQGLCRLQFLAVGRWK